jgi:YkoY family integral membrane protein
MLNYFLIILSVTFIEILLSIDNAAVLSMIANKAGKDAEKVVKYGILGAFLFRGISIFCIGWLLANPDFGAYGKLAGGLYLIRLGYTGLTPQIDSAEEGAENWMGRALGAMGISLFWAAVIECEYLDLVFSIDNLFACVAYTENVQGTIDLGFTIMKMSIFLTIIAVFLGIVAMRFVTTYFIELIRKFPKLEKSAFIVILLLGIKLVLSAALFFGYLHQLSFIENHNFDTGFSIIMLCIFLYPLAESHQYNQYRIGSQYVPDDIFGEFKQIFFVEYKKSFLCFHHYVGFEKDGLLVMKASADEVEGIYLDTFFPEGGYD